MSNNMVNHEGEKKQSTKMLMKPIPKERKIIEKNQTTQEINKNIKLSESQVMNLMMNTEIKEEN